MIHPSTTWRRRAVGIAALGLLVAGSAIAPLGAAATPRKAEPPGQAHDDRRHPMAVKQDALKQQALARRLQGDPAMQRKVAKVGRDQFVELDREGTDRVFVILAEFGDEQFTDPRFQGPPPDGSTTDVTGPLHNEITAPDRSVDNSTLWQADYNTAHYQDMYFNRMRRYWETQSSNRYSVAGEVQAWVKVPFNEALYGRNYCGDIVCDSTKALIRDAMAVWVKGQLDSGKTMAEVTAYLQTFDRQDRYDIDGDGNFAEPDGFIDHFQIVHSGGDEAAGDPHQGSDAIWSHRWYANLQGSGPGGLSGVDIGSNTGFLSSGLVPNNPTGVWVGDYTIQPENGGLGVFVHEYGHDLGLPDLYDTSGNTGGAENSTGFWTLMSSGANIGNGGPNGIGDNPTDLSAWELYQLGWLDAQGTQGPFYQVARAGSTSWHILGPNLPATGKVQAVFVLLPDRVVPLNLGAPFDGATFFYSGSGNDLNNSMTRTGVSGTALSAKVRYAIEESYDYAFLEASTDGGTTWTPVLTNLSATEGDQSGFNTSGTGITGTSLGEWVDLTATLPTGTNALRFRYQSDGGVAESGFQVDALTVDGTAVDSGWTFNGFRETTGAEEQKFFNAYVLENRQYDGYDRSLKTAYNFGFADSRPDQVETFRYQNGLLVWYWDTQYADNNVGDHPGAGLLLPVDARQTWNHTYDGVLARPRILSYDSVFGLQSTESITIHKDSQATTIPGHKPISTFDDTQTWWSDCDQHGCTGTHPGRYQPGWYGVDVPKTGTVVTVTNWWPKVGRIGIKVSPKK